MINGYRYTETKTRVLSSNEMRRKDQRFVSILDQFARKKYARAVYMIRDTLYLYSFFPPFALRLFNIRSQISYDVSVLRE